ncbi:ATP-binding cassette domain-containing protein [Micromonospora echinofusca]|uniref:ATP-binding cassette domain-containing protein n=1 Tax=Micromonospora echinofusca TaxID=47858 RepID=A0ABS3W060_MICEH|nr:ATP-binding cassette domain-containing protein [Micromonospora echinofusca]MBO4210003.1 ATP-binding cassette domain-containing protein [Micromonospora echinofusca]
MLKVRDISFRYGKKDVLTDVSLDLTTGANLFLGRNGAGKTTLMRVLAGAARPHSGEVHLNGEPFSFTLGSDRRILRRVGWLPQTFGFPPRMKVAEFVAYAAWLKEVPSSLVPERSRAVLELVDLTEKSRQPLNSLSGGQLRRAGLAAALVADPDVLILDEPTAGLDPEQRDAFHELIRQVRQEKIVVVATHLLEDVEALAEHIVVIDHGTVRWTGSPAELVSHGGGESGLGGLRNGFQTMIGQRS